MGTTAKKATPGDRIRKAKVGTFIRPSMLPGSSAAVRNALSRAERDGLLVRAREGLYFKGENSRYGMTRPSTVDVAHEVLGRQGVGPAGFSAARHFGVTTQVPAKLQLSTIFPVPQGAIAGVHVHKRNNAARIDLNETEIALLEVLRDPDVLAETGWDAFERVAVAALRRGDIRMPALERAVPGEGPVATRKNFDRLRPALVAA